MEIGPQKAVLEKLKTSHPARILSCDSSLVNVTTNLLNSAANTLS